MTDNAKPARGWKSVVATMLSGHSVLGLALAAPLYVLCLSGTIAVFADEIRRWEQPQGPVVVDMAADTLGAALNAAARAGWNEAGAHDGAEIFIEIPGGEFPRFLVQVADPVTNTAPIWAAEESGALAVAHATPWWDFIVGLHYRLHVPDVWGLILVGALGVFLVSLIISGVLAHPRIFKDAFVLRWGGSKRLQDADIHNRLSVWGLPFHLAVAFSGAFLGLAPLMVNLLVPATYGDNAMTAYDEIYGPGPGADRTAAPLPDLEPIIGEVLRLTPDATIETIILQNAGTAGQLVHVTANRAGQLAQAERHFFSGEGVLLRTAGYDDGPAGIQWVGAMTPLHFGSFGGWPIKLAYGILGAALTLITATGVTIWLARMADRGRVRHGWQRLWSAILWGQPIGLGISALTALGGAPAWTTISYFAAMALSVAAVFLPLEDIRLSRLLRIAGAATLLCVALAHAIVWGASMTDPMGWTINGVIVLLALLMARTAMPRAVH